MKFNKFITAMCGSLIMVFMLTAISNAQWQKRVVETTASLRGLAVVSEKIVWASGTGGTFLRTVDGGKTWKTGIVPDAAKLDFRDVAAFDAETAYLLSIGAGETSRIYKTTDGGANWKLQFANKDPRVFLDAFAFWDAKHGIAMGDPVNGKYTLLETTDGENWQQIETSRMPAAKTGEAAFAASGTCLLTNEKNVVFLVSGGQAARVFRSANRGSSWTVAETPVISGANGAGIFSMAMFDRQNGVIVGGDYEKPNEAVDNLAFTKDGGKTWIAGKGLNGYRSGVAFVDKKTIVAVGSSGSDISNDGGKNWRSLDKANYNAVAAAGKNTVWAVGAGGLVAELKVKN